MFAFVVKRKPLPVTDPSLISVVPKRAFSTRPVRRSPCCSSVRVELTCCWPKADVIVQVPDTLAAAPAGWATFPAGGVPAGGVVPGCGVGPTCGVAAGGGGGPARAAADAARARPPARGGAGRF